MLKNYNRLLLFVFLGALSSLAFGQTVTIGAGAATGTSSNIGPIYRSSAASGFDFSQQYYLYTQSELAAVGINPGDFINSIAFNKDNAFGTVSGNNVSIWRIYMKNSSATPSSTWSSGSFATQSASATMVYENTAQVIPVATGWITLTFGTPFQYTGGSLEVGSSWDCSLFAGNPTTGAFSWKRDPITNQVFGGSNSTSAVTMTLQTGRPQIQLNYTPGAPCTAPPTAGSATASMSSVCPSVNFSVSVSGASYGAGQTYQWQTSTDNTTFTDIAGATNSSYTTSQTTAHYYRLALTCSGMTAYSSSVQVQMNNFMDCYCSSIPTNTSDEEIYNVTINGSSTNPAYANANGCSTVAPGPGSILSRYSNFKTLPAITSVALGQSVSFSIDENECDGATYYSNGIAMWIDFNHNGIFTDAGEQVFVESATSVGPKTVSGTFTVPSTAVPGNTVVRIICAESYSGSGLQPCMSYGFGETEDHVINILCPTLTAPSALDAGVCSNSSATLTASTSTPGGTISWWDSPTGGAQVATGGSYTTPALTTNTSYYPQVDVASCPSGPRDTVTVTVTAVSVTLNPIAASCNGLNNGSFSLGTVSCGTAPFTYSLDGGVTFGAIPADLAAGTYSVIVKDATNATSIAYQVVITQPSAPTALNANATYFTANLGWTAQGNETSWVVEYGPAGFTQGSGTVINPATNPQTITGLTENTQYQFYVAAGCSPTSAFAGPFSFATDPGFLAWENSCGPGFTDISAIGSVAPGMTDDAEYGVTLPFPFLYQGTSFTTATIGNNGGFALGTLTAQIGFSNVAMATATPDNTLFPFWDDMGGNGAGVFYHTIGTAPNRKYIVQWNREHLSVSGNTLVYQLVLDEATNEFWFLYNDVVVGNATYDYGASATIGVTGPQDIQVSFNNASYLQNNSCIHFYYALCPNPTNLTVVPHEEDADVTWNAGLYGETMWTVIYGPAGFDPATEGTIDTVTAASAYLAPLDQNTQYDVYVYSECAADDLTSGGLMATFITKPFCSTPTALTAATDVDSLEAAWNWTLNPNYTDYAVQSFTIEYGPTGFTQGTGVTYTASGTNNADTVVDAPYFLAGGVYQYYLQAVCGSGDSVSPWTGPISFTMPLSNDLVCSAETLPVDGIARTFNNTGATVSTNEGSIAPPATGAQTTTGWVNQTLNGTVWFKFVAPNSGNVRVNATGINYNGQAAVYSVDECSNFATFELKAANDDAIGGTSLAPNFTICGLTPMEEYYLMFDAFNTTFGNYSMAISAINLEAGMANTTPAILNVCTGSPVELFNTINGQQTGGVWSSSIPAVNASISGSTLTTEGLAYTAYDLQYRVTEGCAYDSVFGKVRIYAPSNAGNDGSITACRNQTVNLITGLNGNADLGGTWYTPAGAVNANGSYVTTSNTQGNYNYMYIAGNGVCPNDTALVVINVGSCNVLDLEEQTFAGVEVFPNPSAGIVFVTSDNNFSYSVTDANGRVITSAQNGVKAAQKTEINLSNVERGVYFIRLNNDDAQKVYRVVIN